MSPIRPPLAFLLTFATYGSWLHGDPRGSVNTKDNAFGAPRFPRSPVMLNYELHSMKGPPIVFTEEQRRAVESAIIETCRVRGWKLHALNVRTMHVHAVISGDAMPEKMMADLKAYATRRLVERGLVQHGARVWARHGSTRWLWTEGSVAAACEYVLEGQGGREGVCGAAI